MGSRQRSVFSRSTSRRASVYRNAIWRVLANMTTIPQKIAKAQEDANKYIELHQVDKHVTRLMNAIIKEQPEDPRVFMINWLSKECTDAELEDSGLERTRKLPGTAGSKKDKT